MDKIKGENMSINEEKVQRIKEELMELQRDLENDLENENGLGERFIDYLNCETEELTGKQLLLELIDSADERILEFIERGHLEKLNNEELKELLLESIEPMYFNNLKMQDNELISTVIGEQEEPLPDYIMEELKELTEEELKEVKSCCEICLDPHNEYLYIGSNYDQWALVVDYWTLRQNFDSLERRKREENERKSRALIDDKNLPENTISLARFVWEKPEAKEKAINRSNNKWNNNLSFIDTIRRNIANKNRLENERDDYNKQLAKRLGLKSI